MLQASKTEIDLVMDSFDEFESAAQRIVTALPFQMTEAAARLDDARKTARRALHDFVMAHARTVVAAEREEPVAVKPPSTCTNEMRRLGLSYPRTCKVCRLGPCPYTSQD